MRHGKIFRKIAAGLAVVAGIALCGGSLVSAQAPVVGSEKIAEIKADADTAIVYFTKHIDAKHLIKLYNLVNGKIGGKVAIKLHTGERNGLNILPREMVRQLQEAIPNSALVETNVAYNSERKTTEGHREILKANGWTFSEVDIMDAGEDVSLPVKNPFHLREVAMGGHIVNYDSMLVLTHFKGHASGGFGGSLKNIAIGNASGKLGKRQVHGFNLTGETDFRGKRARGDEFMENMADSGQATLDFFQGRMAFINVMRRLSVDCDCAGARAKEPTTPDIGIAASTDILAVDQASVDMVFNMPPTKNADLVERINSRHGLRQLSAMGEKRMGKAKYVLVCIDAD